MNNSNHPAMYKVRIPAGRISMHQTDDFLFTYVLAGSGFVSVNGKKLPISKGSAFIIGRNERVLFKSDKGIFLQMVHVHLAEKEIEDYLLHNAAPRPLSASDTNSMKQLPNHLLLQSFVAGIETGMEQGFRANNQLTFLKVQECINIVIFLYPELHN